ncbi:MAG: hypothetical protein R3C05_28115 [Pirellulaceae bacterium]
MLLNWSWSVTGEEQGSTLYWAAGDNLSGQVVRSDEKTLWWRSPLFSEPLQIQTDVLSSIILPEAKHPIQALEDRFRLTMLNGDTLYGDLIGVSSKQVELQSSRHGRLHIDRDAIGEIMRVDMAGLIYENHGGLDGWKHASVARRGTPFVRVGAGGGHGGVTAQWNSGARWVAEPDGSLYSNGSMAALTREFEASGMMRIDVEVESSALPAFVMSLMTAGNSKSLRLEVWQDTLVAVDVLDFIELAVLKPTDRKIRLSLFIDYEHDRLVVFNDRGVRIGEMRIDARRSHTHTLKFDVRDHDLRIKQLRIATWKGSIPEVLPTGQASLHLVDGSVFNGQILSSDEDGQTLRFKTDDAANVDASSKSEPSEDALTVRVDQIQTIFMQSDAEIGRSVNQQSVAWHNGLVSGKITAITPETISVQTDYSREPITSKLTNATKIRFSSTDSPVQQSDRLVFDGGSLRGTLVIEPHPESPIRWKPLGAVESVGLETRQRAQFIRREDDTTSTNQWRTYDDTVYLANRDVIPCKLLSFATNAIRSIRRFWERSNCSPKMCPPLNYRCRSMSR